MSEEFDYFQHVLQHVVAGVTQIATAASEAQQNPPSATFARLVKELDETVRSKAQALEDEAKILFEQMAPPEELAKYQAALKLLEVQQEASRLAKDSGVLNLGMVVKV